MAGSVVAQDTGPYATGGCASVPILPAAIPVVEVRIGGKGPYRFAIDTGTPGHGRITPALAAELGFPQVGASDGPPVFGASEVSVGGVSFKNLDLLALGPRDSSAPEVDGVLGSGLLQLLPLTLDFGNGRVRFGGVELSEGLLLDFDRGVPVLPVEITGNRFPVRFDTGNPSAALFLDEEAATALPLAGEPVEWLGLDTAGHTEAPLAVSVTAGNVALAIRTIAWPAPREHGNLGARGMAGMTVTLDATSELATVEPSRSPPRCPA
jgi:hypothetical protein